MARSSSSDGSVASALTPSAFRAVVPIAPPRITNLSLSLAKSTATFGAATGSLRISDQGRTLQQGPRWTRRPCLRERSWRGGSWRPSRWRQPASSARRKLLHLGDRQAGVVGHDDDPGVSKTPVQRRDELMLFRSIHVLSPVGDPTVGPPPVAPAAPVGREARAGATLSALSPRAEPRAGAMVRTV